MLAKYLEYFFYFKISLTEYFPASALNINIFYLLGSRPVLKQARRHSLSLSNLFPLPWQPPHLNVLQFILLASKQYCLMLPRHGPGCGLSRHIFWRTENRKKIKFLRLSFPRGFACVGSLLPLRISSRNSSLFHPPSCITHPHYTIIISPPSSCILQENLYMSFYQDPTTSFPIFKNLFSDFNMMMGYSIKILR